MPGRFSKDVDLRWSSMGDYTLDSVTGDLEDTKRIKYQTLIQRADTRIRSSPSDWRIASFPTANLGQFYGKPNDAETGQAIRENVYAALTTGDFLRPTEVQVEVFPLSQTEVAVVVKLSPGGQRHQIYLNYTYDGRDNKIIPRNV